MTSIGTALKTVGLFVIASVTADVLFQTGITPLVADLLVDITELLVDWIRGQLGI
jgi:hypothetical protein